MEPAGTTDKPEGEDQTPQLAKSKTVDGWETKAIRIRTGGKTANSGAAQMRRALTEAFKKALDKEPAYQFKSINELTHAEYDGALEALCRPQRASRSRAAKGIPWHQRQAARAGA